MEATCLSYTLVPVYQATRLRIHEDRNIKFYILLQNNWDIFVNFLGSKAVLNRLIL
jgi:hypothetical protein